MPATNTSPKPAPIDDRPRSIASSLSALREFASVALVHGGVPDWSLERLLDRIETSR